MDLPSSTVKTLLVAATERQRESAGCAAIHAMGNKNIGGSKIRTCFDILHPLVIEIVP